MKVVVQFRSVLRTKCCQLRSVEKAPEICASLSKVPTVEGDPVVSYKNAKRDEKSTNSGRFFVCVAL